MITKETALSLPLGKILHHASRKNADGTPMRVRVTGQVKTWKTRPEYFRIPVKYGLRTCGYVGFTEELNNAAEWEVAK